ncbi:MAG: hypothetical protein PHC34_09530 [Candidatus Gastranaerophilales bacterium]|nr:hypothetical protein [Candidatus Gastranaerophilales bacterium]
MEVSKLYPQFQSNDRRQQNTSVGEDKRSGIDRRINIDSNLRKDIKQVKDTFEAFRTPTYKDNKDDSLNIESGALSTIPFIRRFVGVQNAIYNHEYFKGFGKALIQIINVKGDWGDIKKAFGEILKLDFKKHEYQRPFGFFRDTFLENIQVKNPKLNAVIDKAYSLDKTLYDFIPVKKLLDKFGNKSPEYLGESVKNNGNIIVKVLGRSFMRIPILSSVFLGLFEIPAICKAENKNKQLIKSSISIISFISCGAILGAIGAYAGAFGSLAGLGIGSYLGNKLANKINSNL